MTIGSGDVILKFGTQDTVSSGNTSAVANGNCSVTGDAATWTNDDDAPFADFVLQVDPASAPSAGGTVVLYDRLHDIDSTNDAPVPDANYKGQRIGSFLIDADASAHYVPITGGPVPIPGQYTSQVHEFYIENRIGVSIDAGWTLKVTPVTYGPHA